MPRVMHKDKHACVAGSNGITAATQNTMRGWKHKTDCNAPNRQGVNSLVEKERMMSKKVKNEFCAWCGKPSKNYLCDKCYARWFDEEQSALDAKKDENEYNQMKG